GDRVRQRWSAPRPWGHHCITCGSAVGCSGYRRIRAGLRSGRLVGICVPMGTPTSVIDKLNAEISGGVVDPVLKARLLALGVEPMVETPVEFDRFVAGEIEKWSKVITFAGIKATL